MNAGEKRGKQNKKEVENCDDVDSQLERSNQKLRKVRTHADKQSKT